MPMVVRRLAALRQQPPQTVEARRRRRSRLAGRAIPSSTKYHSSILGATTTYYCLAVHWILLLLVLNHPNQIPTTTEALTLPSARNAYHRTDRCLDARLSFGGDRNGHDDIIFGAAIIVPERCNRGNRNGVSCLSAASRGGGIDDEPLRQLRITFGDDPSKKEARLDKDDESKAISNGDGKEVWLGRRGIIRNCFVCGLAAWMAAATPPSQSVASALEEGDVTSVSAGSATGGGSTPSSSEGGSTAAGAAAGGGYQMITTPSGLKFTDLKVGEGPTPRYGQMLTFSYKGYLRVAGKEDKDKTPPMFDRDDAFLHKHGNGKLVPGLDEGLHTMKVGGKRRIIIPPKLGYVRSGLGPLPEGWYGRLRLNQLLEDMITARGGQLIFEVELRAMHDDEADQGYYDDVTISPEDFETLKNNIQKKGRDARERGEVSGMEPRSLQI